MTRRSTRSIQLAAATCVAMLLLSLLAAPAVEAWPSVCDNCVKNNDVNGQPDAQCCLDGRCHFWYDRGYFPLLTNMEWCTSWVDGNTAGCHGHQNSCTANGGDGSEDGCTLQPGEYCPPSCVRCYYAY